MSMRLKDASGHKVFKIEIKKLSPLPVMRTGASIGQKSAKFVHSDRVPKPAFITESQ